MLNIKQRQMNLKFLNFYNGNVDGIEGKGTKQAYKSFQKEYGLAADGIYGKKTDAKLVEVIKDIQRKLGASVDGVAGANTTQKCKDYQYRHDLLVDGICGAKTRAKLYELTWDDIKYFKKSEFTCKCGCGTNNIELELVQILDGIRAAFGKPLIVTSGCRCKSHNARVGGVQGSRHVLGKAADIKVSGVPKSTLLSYTKNLVSQGKLRYTYTNDTNMNGVVHVDIN